MKSEQEENESIEFCNKVCKANNDELREETERLEQCNSMLYCAVIFFAILSSILGVAIGI